MRETHPIPVALVGGRGYVGAELIRLLAAHPRFELAFVASRERAGARIADHVDGAPELLHYGNAAPGDLPDFPEGAYILALPNGKAGAYVDAIGAAAPGSVVVDLSADYRFDAGWTYGLPEHRPVAAGTRRISNPGCYATAMQLALAPMLDVLDGPAQCFGVSGYSGAGTAPSPKNDPEQLRDNLMPYALAGHVHEAEVSRHLAHPVEFMPHVAPHFRGLSITANLHLQHALERAEVMHRYRQAYGAFPLVHVVDDAPWVSRIAGRHHAEIGGFTLSQDGRRLVVVATLDNLLKGAATQALQNLNAAFGLDPMSGIPADPFQQERAS